MQCVVACRLCLFVWLLGCVFGDARYSTHDVCVSCLCGVIIYLWVVDLLYVINRRRLSLLESVFVVPHGRVIGPLYCGSLIVWQRFATSLCLVALVL